jgi:hypothetical protein
LVPLHVLHSPPVEASAHAVLQHSPSVQKPLWHWLAAVHDTPLALRPQVLFAQMLTPEQSCAWVAGVQLFLQAPEAQVKGSQALLLGVTQLPLPSQVEAGVSVDAPAQAEALQLVPCA